MLRRRELGLFLLVALLGSGNFLSTFAQPAPPPACPISVRVLPITIPLDQPPAMHALIQGLLSESLKSQVSSTEGAGDAFQVAGSVSRQDAGFRLDLGVLDPQNRELTHFQREFSQLSELPGLLNQAVAAFSASPADPFFCNGVLKGRRTPPMPPPKQVTGPSHYHLMVQGEAHVDIHTAEAMGSLFAMPSNGTKGDISITYNPVDHSLHGEGRIFQVAAKGHVTSDDCQFDGGGSGSSYPVKAEGTVTQGTAHLAIIPTGPMTMDISGSGHCADGSGGASRVHQSAMLGANDAGQVDLPFKVGGSRTYTFQHAEDGVTIVATQTYTFTDGAVPEPVAPPPPPPDRNPPPPPDDSPPPDSEQREETTSHEEETDIPHDDNDLDPLQELVKRGVDSVKDGAETLIDAVERSPLPDTVNRGMDAIQDAADTIADPAGRAVDAVKDAGGRGVDTLIDAGEQLWDSLNQPGAPEE